jgi:ribonuclease HI
MKAILYTDGGARGNPGPAGIGVMLQNEEGELLGEVSRPIGETTNNVAEYEALIAGLELAVVKGVTRLRICSDSELVVSQIEGKWKIKNDRLRALAVRARSLMKRFDSVSIEHVPRAQNADADRLANRAMDEAEVVDPIISPGQQSLLE